jgi:FkbH-like protein
MPEDPRHAIDAAIERREWARALALLDRHFRDSPSIGSAQLTLDRLRRIEHPGPRTAVRLAILRSFTIEPVVPLLRAGAALRGVDVEVWTGGFNTYAQELLDPAGALAAFGPDVVLLAVQTRDLVPDLWDRFAGMPAGAAARAALEVVASLRQWIESFRARSSAHVVVSTFEVPDMPAAGVLDVQSPDGQTEAVRQLNRGLSALAAELPGVHVFDYDGLVARHGRRRWHDERRWLTARMPLGAESLAPLAEGYLRLLLPLAGRVAKALVVDLDNTLWGGAVGEEGVEGIQLGPEYPGAGYLALQRVIRALYDRGILLAVASKNNDEDALAALDGHPSMLLRSGDFAALRINWNDKARGLREIAAELNIGTDALAFLDDSPAERELIRLELPEVTVVELPSDPMGYARALADCPVFERLSLTQEDRERGRLYAEQRERTELRQAATSLEDFLHSLETEMAMDPAELATAPRVAQLTEKTNQFNLTTRRYSEQEIRTLAADPCVRIYDVRVRDRFGDSGVVGVVIARVAGDAWEIDTLLLSCRVIGRAIETAMVARLAADARAAGATALHGWFLPTRKNAPASDFYPSHGFSLVESRDGATRWELDVRDGAPRVPGWIAAWTARGDAHGR